LACPGCYRCFSEEKGLAAHTKDGTCHRANNGQRLEGLTADQVKQLRKRKREADKPEDKKWREMYRIVFPNEDASLVPSPCLC
jgi:hypothetical protein